MVTFNEDFKPYRDIAVSESDSIKDYLLRLVLKSDVDKGNQTHAQIQDTATKSSELQEEVRNRWDKMFWDVEKYQDKDNFIITSFNSRIGDKESLRVLVHPNESMLYGNMYEIIKKMVTDEQTCKRYMVELEEDAEFFSMLNGEIKYPYRENKGDVFTSIVDCAGYVQVPLLAAHRKWGKRGKPEDYSSLVSLLAKFFSISTVIDGDPSKIYEIMTQITKMINWRRSLDAIQKKLLTKDDHGNFKANLDLS